MFVVVIEPATVDDAGVDTIEADDIIGGEEGVEDETDHAGDAVFSEHVHTIINYIPGLHLRASEEAELLGMDDDQLGEFAYDYVEVRRDYLAWTPARDEPEKTESNINPPDRHGIPQHSDMINGQSPERHSGRSDHAIIGDRHGIAAEDKEKEKRGIANGNGEAPPA